MALTSICKAGARLLALGKLLYGGPNPLHHCAPSALARRMVPYFCNSQGEKRLTLNPKPEAPKSLKSSHWLSKVRVGLGWAWKARVSLSIVEISSGP